MNGNITMLTRYLKGTGQIDNLTYTYKSGNASNMLDRVDDAVAVAEGFSEYVKQDNEYAFDGNGNLIKDDNKGYSSILYNYLNLPKRVGTTGSFISYVYDAVGTKLAKVGTGGAYTYYAGSFVYSGSSLNYILNREGMYLPGGNYQYYLKDHLGNTRLVVNTLGTGGEIVQQTDYYPFGMDIANYNYGNANKYRYNGKEFQDDLINGKNLDWYDYGARFYDPIIGRWHIPDPMAEKYRGLSPYSYCVNNPIRFIDPNGMEIDLSKMSKEERQRYESQITDTRNHSKLFDAMYSYLEKSKNVITVNFGQTVKTENGDQVDGQFVPNKKGEGGVVTFLKGTTEIKSGALSEELFHAYQNENNNKYESGEFNREFEAKVAVTAIGTESQVGYGIFGGMVDFQSKIGYGDYGKNFMQITPQNAVSSSFFSDYRNAANKYAKYNRDNNIGNINYRKNTTVAPYSLIKTIIDAYDK